MDELLRLDYLEAMGITQYVAHTPLPGARPSPVIHVDTALSETVLLETEHPASVTALFDDDFSSAKKSPTPLTSILSISTSSISTASLSTTPSPASTSITFQCQIAIWTVDDLLILADAPRMDNNQITLLRNILQAIGRTGNLSDVRQFSWPLAQRKEKHLSAARDHFQGLLDGGLLKNPGLRQILCFGENVLPLLATDLTITLQQYQDWPIVTTCSLQDMIEQPGRKAHTWRVLQVLVRA
jgi:hypothetical protein